MSKQIFKNIKLLFVCFTISSSAISQINEQIALLHSRYDTDTTTSESITAYWFNGNKIIIDTIITRIASKNSKVESRLSIGLNDIIVKNRYLYTTMGLLIDLKQKKIILQDPGSFVKEQNDTIFFTPKGSRDNFVLNGYSIKTGKMKRILRRPFENNIRFISPDYNNMVSVNYSKLENRSIYVIDKKGNKKLAVADIGEGPVMYGGSHAFGHIPVKWINNESFIYLKYFRTKTNGTVWQKPKNLITDSSEMVFSTLVKDTLPSSKGEFRIYNIESGINKLLVKTDSLYAPAFEDKFLDYDSMIIFRNWGFSFYNYWKINIGDSSISRYNFNSDFFTKTDTAYHTAGFNQYKKIVYFKGALIGSFYGQDYKSDGSTYVACGRLEPNGKSYIMFWNDKNQQWLKAELNGFLGLISLFKPSW